MDGIIQKLLDCSKDCYRMKGKRVIVTDDIGVTRRIPYEDFFKVKIYNKYYHNNLILRIRDNSRKHRPIKVVGWYVTSNLLSIIKNPKNWI